MENQKQHCPLDSSHGEESDTIIGDHGNQILLPQEPNETNELNGGRMRSIFYAFNIYLFMYFLTISLISLASAAPAPPAVLGHFSTNLLAPTAPVKTGDVIL